MREGKSPQNGDTEGEFASKIKDENKYSSQGTSGTSKFTNQKEFKPKEDSNFS